MRARPATLFPALLLALAGAWVTAPSADAATVTDGHCSTDTGVTVVVDHQELGGGIVVKCVEGYEPGASGLEVIRAAGFAPEGTVHDGSGFVCRLGGRPGVNETIPLASDPGYRETCVDTPPNGAFWAYFHADNGGAWTFSNLGAGNREAIPGGYEAFSFSLNRSEGANPAPGVQPSHEVVKPTPTPAQTIAAPAPAPEPTRTVEPRPKDESPSAPRKTTRPTVSANPVPPSDAPTPEPTTETPTPTPTLAPTPEASSPSPSVSAPESPEVADEPTTVSATPTASATVVTTPAPPVDAVMEDNDPPVGTFIGLGAVGALALGGGAVWWRRRGL